MVSPDRQCLDGMRCQPTTFVPLRPGYVRWRKSRHARKRKPRSRLTTGPRSKSCIRRIATGVTARKVRAMAQRQAACSPGRRNSYKFARASLTPRRCCSGACPVPRCPRRADRFERGATSHLGYVCPLAVSAHIPVTVSGGSPVAVNLIVLAVTFMMAAFIVVWFFFPGLRRWMEMPKYRFLERQAPVSECVRRSSTQGGAIGEASGGPALG